VSIAAVRGPSRRSQIATQTRPKATSTMPPSGRDPDATALPKPAISPVAASGAVGIRAINGLSPSERAGASESRSSGTDRCRRVRAQPARMPMRTGNPALGEGGETWPTGALCYMTRPYSETLAAAERGIPRHYCRCKDCAFSERSRCPVGRSAASGVATTHAGALSRDCGETAAAHGNRLRRSLTARASICGRRAWRWTSSPSLAWVRSLC
jgi:hypothetical protein